MIPLVFGSGYSIPTANPDSQTPDPQRSPRVNKHAKHGRYLIFTASEPARRVRADHYIRVSTPVPAGCAIHSELTHLTSPDS